MRNTKISLILGAALVLSSCSDFLERKPIAFFTPDDISTGEDVKKLLTGTYRSLIWQEGDMLMPTSQDFMCDDGFCNSPTYGELQMWRGTQTSYDGYFETAKWVRDYEGILRANSVIYYAPLVSDLGETLRDRYVAEAKFLRAYYYADLIEFYGDVPYRTEIEGLKEKISPRVDKNIILNNILLDLDEAAEILPPEYSETSDFGRATKGAAYALKARICLYNYKYDWCIDACRKVMDLNIYDLHPSYEELFTPEVERTNKEYIFQQQFVAGRSEEDLSGIFWTKYSAFSAYMVSQNLVDEYYMQDTGLRFDAPGSGYSDLTPYSNRDPRLLFTIKVDQGSMTGAESTGYKLQKFVDDDANAAKVHRNDEVDFPLLRYADVLLMLAEALVETGTYDYDEVVGIVNRIRQRGDVMMPIIEEVEGKDGALSRDELREVIRHERRVEFAFEGLRNSDVRRWKIGPEVLTDCYAAVKAERENPDDPENPIIYYTSKVFMERTFNEAKGYLWPIPAIELQTNPMENNPGYTN